jgi:poly-beta-1,6-N-acetyl-D-glucosamine synthase
VNPHPSIVEDPKDTRAGRYSYVLITPARNEAQFIELTIKSVVAQSVRPDKWVIVSDGSTDGTDEIVSRYVAEHPWIELLRKPERKERHFAAKVDAFNAGYAKLQECQYQVIGNLDADISFEAADYFEFLMRKFAENPTLGVAGTAYREGDILYPRGFTSIEDVFGACQMFRRECFEGIGGYRPVRTGGIDLIAFLSARAEGWQTRTFTEKVCLHHRKVGSAQHAGVCKRLLQGGRKDYLHGSHPAFEVFRSIYQMKNKPYIVGGMLVMAGYFWAVLKSLERTIPTELIELRRIDQMSRLTGILKRAFRLDAAFGRHAGSAESR